MTLEEIRELIALANEHGLAEIEFERDGTRVRIRRATVEHDVVIAPAPAAAQPPAQPLLPAAVPQAAPPVKARPAAPSEKLLQVKAPIVGTYYESPSPGARAFVQVGDRVSKGQVLCIIESMKLMNEIESEVSGVVVEKIAANASAVGYGEPLLSVRVD